LRWEKKKTSAKGRQAGTHQGGNWYTESEDAGGRKIADTWKKRIEELSKARFKSWWWRRREEGREKKN